MQLSPGSLIKTTFSWSSLTDDVFIHQCPTNKYVQNGKPCGKNKVRILLGVIVNSSYKIDLEVLMCLFFFCRDTATTVNVPYMTNNVKTCGGLV